ncbi:alpha/beta hydrolase [uncultured Nitratireductor sp.]|uniref:alpha/beta fold hydrolase n=1 Tax=uncultured Nitratireductor sp. TaxID=520953 RepID=UPI0025F3EAE4|nr:alpha/beta hydrolase [uncultured Nitratireductor sp.]
MTIYAPQRTTSPGKTIHLNSVEIYYEEYGTGQPLVLLHGFGGCSQNWYPFIDQLFERYRLILVDLRGHGYSTNPDNRFTHRDAAGDVFLLLDELGIASFSAMGISSGAMALLHMATRKPERIDSMVLISTTTHFPDQARAIMRRASIGTLPQDVQEMYRECAKRGDEQVRQLLSQFNALAENDDDMNFTKESLSAITARTLIVHGDRDNFFPVEIPLDLYRSIPNAELWIIPGSDHSAVFDAATPFASTALRFLDRQR